MSKKIVKIYVYTRKLRRYDLKNNKIYSKKKSIDLNVFTKILEEERDLELNNTAKFTFNLTAKKLYKSYCKLYKRYNMDNYQNVTIGYSLCEINL